MSNRGRQDRLPFTIFHAGRKLAGRPKTDRVGVVENLAKLRLARSLRADRVKKFAAAELLFCGCKPHNGSFQAHVAGNTGLALANAAGKMSLMSPPWTCVLTGAAPAFYPFSNLVGP